MIDVTSMITGDPPPGDDCTGVLAAGSCTMDKTKNLNFEQARTSAQYRVTHPRGGKAKKAEVGGEPPFRTAVASSQAEVLRLRRNAEARKAFLDEFGTLTSKEVAELAGSRATNRAALANRWKVEGRIFAVETGGQTLFPAFQFSEDDGQPRPIIAKILAALGHQYSGWQTALWFSGRNGWLGAQRPVDLLRSAPGAVAEAAQHVAEAFD
ncbi:MAG TPA: hypothetical protein VFE33_08475 [Thermoanaerobaculia bacterium]|nr:hypothetical protein [Thermoanaerobaculia bacterium]